MTSIRTDPILHQASVLDELNHVVEVTIIRPGEAKVTFDGAQVSYSEDALQSSLPLWEGAACFCDHFNKSVRNLSGVFFSPWYDDGVKAKLRFIDDGLYSMIARIVADREEGLAVPDIGISADIAINGASSITDDVATFQVSEISQVISADIVFSPAAGGSFDRILNSVRAADSAAALGAGGAESSQSSASQGPGDAKSPESSEIAEDQNEKTTESTEPPETDSEDTLVPEKRVRDLQSTADKLRNQVTNQEAQISHLQGQLTEAVSKYRDEVLQQHPEIPTELVSGNTVEEIDTSLGQARALVDKVRQHSAERVPPGAPARGGPDVSAMSPAEKISYGLKQRGQGG